MKKWDIEEKSNKYMEQEAMKISADMEQLSKQIDDAIGRFQKLPMYKKIYHRILCFFVLPIFKIILYIRWWYDKKQSPYHGARELR